MVANCSGFIEPLNLECILVNMMAGSMTIFIAISFLILAGMAARFRMPKGIALMMVVLFVVIFADMFLPIYLLVIILLGLLVFIAISRMIKH